MRQLSTRLRWKRSVMEPKCSFTGKTDMTEETPGDILSMKRWWPHDARVCSAETQLLCTPAAGEDVHFTAVHPNFITGWVMCTGTHHGRNTHTPLWRWAADSRESWEETDEHTRYYKKIMYLYEIVLLWCCGLNTKAQKAGNERKPTRREGQRLRKKLYGM